MNATYLNAIHPARSFVRSFVLLLGLLVAPAGYAQRFAGRILYQNTFTDLNGTDISARLSPYMGKEQRYYIADSAYKAYNEKDQLIQLYRPATNTYYFAAEGQPARQLDAATVTSQKHQVTRLKGTAQIAGYACQSIRVETDYSTVVYSYSSRLRVNPAAFSRHFLGEWSQYLAASDGGLPLKIVLTHHRDGYRMTSTATRVEALPLTASDFTLPPDWQADPNPDPVTSFDYGRLDGQTYRNAFFGFSLQVPTGWAVQDDQQKKALQEAGRNLVSGDNQNLKAVLKASEVKTANLLMVYQHEPGAPVDFNPSFVLVAENLAPAPGIKKGEDYLFHARKLLEQTQLHYSFPKAVYTAQLGGREFVVLEADLDLNGLRVRQRYLVHITNQFCLAFITSSANETEADALQRVLDSVRFD